jgi:hypothetical protein
MPTVIEENTAPTNSVKDRKGKRGQKQSAKRRREESSNEDEKL